MSDETFKHGEMADPAATPRPTRRPQASLAHGIAVIADTVRTLPGRPGVYRMLNTVGDVLYVGKARNLKKRVTSYARPDKLSIRIKRMVAETAAMEVVTTHTEVEALLLESNLIKRLMPRYNVLLRDDKSFPYILVTAGHDFPRIAKHRGARNRAGDYFGPFASAGAVNQTIAALQRVFLLRPCADTVFAARTRPCLQYQIKRCTAPCVGRVDREAYGAQVRQARDFLSGRSREVQQEFADAMQRASVALDFETAARYRDRLRALAHTQSHQDINVEGLADADVVALAQEAGQSCVQVFFFRSGHNYGNRAYFPSHERGLAAAEVLASFLGQFYDNKPPPRLVMVSHDPDDRALLAEALAVRAGHAVELVRPQRGPKRKLIEHALANAKLALGRRLAESASQRRLLEGVAAAFGLDAPPARIEIYDNSHVSGTNAVGAMVVAGPEGWVKSAYRKFNIQLGAAATTPAMTPPIAPPMAPGDDYAMMRQVLTRRFQRALKEDPDRARETWPDLVLIDGGQGQFNVAAEVFAELGIADVAIVSIAKGPDRNAGRERFFMAGPEPFSLEPNDPVLFYLQRLRDEAHRFAIETHRARRTKAMGQSTLDDVAGIGAARKRALLHHFGTAKAVGQAGLADLERVPGINKAVAKKIYDHFHDDG
jgi:excinuclease ABC subunit C